MLKRVSDKVLVVLRCTCFLTRITQVKMIIIAGPLSPLVRHLQISDPPVELQVPTHSQLSPLTETTQQLGTLQWISWVELLT